jgi:hypothetical protein
MSLRVAASNPADEVAGSVIMERFLLVLRTGQERGARAAETWRLSRPGAD